MHPWQVRGSKEGPAIKSYLGIEMAVLVTMECTEVETLKCIDFLPYCGGFRAHCLVWREKDVEKDESTTENMEVDTPSSEKEARQDRDGGPSKT